MRQLQLVAHGEPSDVIELNSVAEPALGQEDVLISMEAAPLNPSDFMLVRGIYGVRPALPFSLGSEGVGRVTQTGSKVDVALQGKRVLILPTYEQGTWADQVVVPVRNVVLMSDEADPLQLSMIGINPATAYLLLKRYVSLIPGDWIGQTAANSAMGQYIIALAKLAGVKTLNVVRRKNAAQQVQQWGGDRVVLQGENLHKDIEEALDGKKLSLVLDTIRLRLFGFSREPQGRSRAASHTRRVAYSRNSRSVASSRHAHTVCPDSSAPIRHKNERSR
jgi:NADPH:quinone reductase-like Zn-dependent oxidoreductase